MYLLLLVLAGTAGRVSCVSEARLSELAGQRGARSEQVLSQHLAPNRQVLACEGTVPNPCGAGARCELEIYSDLYNYKAQYKCSCPPGFTGDSFSMCEDTDECVSSVCGGRGAECRNVPGSYVCGCGQGFHYNPYTLACMEVDECTADDRCHPKGASCQNTRGSFTCSCNPQLGYYGDGFNCTFPHKCWGEASVCGARGVCELDVLTGEARACACGAGFVATREGNSPSCSDVDECESGEARCEGQRLARCENTPGSYRCKCQAGVTNASLVESRDGCRYDSVHLCGKIRQTKPGIRALCGLCYPTSRDITPFLLNACTDDVCKEEASGHVGDSMCYTCKKLIWNLMARLVLAKNQPKYQYCTDFDNCMYLPAPHRDEVDKYKACSRPRTVGDDEV